METVFLQSKIVLELRFRLHPAVKMKVLQDGIIKRGFFQVVENNLNVFILSVFCSSLKNLEKILDGYASCSFKCRNVEVDFFHPVFRIRFHTAIRIFLTSSVHKSRSLFPFVVRFAKRFPSFFSSGEGGTAFTLHPSVMPVAYSSPDLNSFSIFLLRFLFC